jgi:hypothetical protein
MFVAEDTDFWNEDAGEGANPFSINKYSVDWDSDGTDMTLTHPQEMNYVGVMLGDVNNSWSAPDDAVKLPQSHLNQLEEDGIAPLEQWNLSPDADIEPPTINPTTADAVIENSGAGQVVYTASSFDNSATFSLTADSDPALSINSLSGAVTLAANPDYEYQSQYSFAVIATDAAGNESTAHAVTVEITNVDDAAPSITSGETGYAVDENSGAGEVVYTAAATDDADTSDGFSFSLAAGSDAAVSIDAVTGEVTLNTDPDHETQSQYSFTVVATDVAGNVSLGQAVILDITDVDDTAAIITSDETADAIDENSGSGQVIYTATADDSADVEYGQVTFSLAAGFDAGLSINATTGEVTLTADPDHETKSEYNFSVVAIDAAGNTSDAKAVTLDINNLDDTAPIITSSARAEDNNNTVDDVGNEVAVFGELNENSGAGQVIYTATADDSADVSDGFTFSLAAGFDAGLSVNTTTGEVTLTADPDHETKSEYNFSVIATDAEGNTSEAKAVTLDINDLDEVAPSIDSGDTGTSVDENSGADQVVYTATASDDADTSDGFSFSLADESLGFSIDAESGVVTTNADFAANYEDATVAKLYGSCL